MIIRKDMNVYYNRTSLPLVAQIHEYKGEQTLFVEAKADTLTQLLEVAKIQSTEASNKIEGIYTFG